MSVRERRIPSPNFGPTLRAVRERAGLGLRETARRAGVSAGYLANLEAGRRSPSMTALSALADVTCPTAAERATLAEAAVRDAGRDHPARRHPSSTAA
ncbi:helix-turn-helix transcriptional regulator [Streptomyces klenkii]|uniref:helix-turn-helix domain-containing protein n=1 Tax=Streptomyces klenkii TaxID=1420899 RepID=UPI0033BA382F